MPNRAPNQTVDAKTVQLIWTISQIAAIWALSDLGYFLLLPAFGVMANYNSDSIAVTLYYGFWTGIAVITFWPLYLSWSQYGRWETFENRLTSYLVWCLAFAACIFFSTYILPSLPAVPGPKAGTRPTSGSLRHHIFCRSPSRSFFSSFLSLRLFWHYRPSAAVSG